jgi:hypothetical protein
MVSFTTLFLILAFMGVVIIIIIGLAIWRRHAVQHHTQQTESIPEQPQHTLTPTMWYTFDNKDYAPQHTEKVIKIRNGVATELGMSVDTLQLHLANEAKDVAITQPSVLMYVVYCPSAFNVNETRFQEFLALNKKIKKLHVKLIILLSGAAPKRVGSESLWVRNSLQRFDFEVLEFGFMNDDMLPYKDAVDFNHDDMTKLVQQVRKTTTTT